MSIENYIDVLKESRLFDSIEGEDIYKIIPCLNYKIKSYSKGSSIFMEGDFVENIGIVLSGVCEITKENLAGDKVIVSIVKKSDMFAESIVCRKDKKSPVNVTAIEDTKVVFISYDRIIRSCNNKCEFHINLINNLLMIIAQKNFILNNKIDILLLKGMREKIATFLLRKYKETGKESFNIELNRNQLAEYLNVCRSSLSRELSKMQDEDIISYSKNKFIIKDIDALRRILL